MSLNEQNIEKKISSTKQVPEATKTKEMVQPSQEIKKTQTEFIKDYTASEREKNQEIKNISQESKAELKNLQNEIETVQEQKKAAEKIEIKQTSRGKQTYQIPNTPEQIAQAAQKGREEAKMRITSEIEEAKKSNTLRGNIINRLDQKAQ